MKRTATVPELPLLTTMRSMNVNMLSVTAMAHALGAYEQIRNDPALTIKKPVKKNKVKA